MRHSRADKPVNDLEIRIFRLEDHGYPVEFTLAGQQEFPRGYLDADLVPWTSGGDLLADGRRLFDAHCPALNRRATKPRPLKRASGSPVYGA